MNIAIQGIAGSFHAQAATELFTGHDPALVECTTFRDVFDAVSNGRADYGMVAIENSLHGSINPVYRLLAEKKLNICGEIRLHIKLYLIGHDNHGPDMVNIPLTEVMSQREALSQCEQWLATSLEHAKLSEASDTAEAVRNVVELKDSAKLAIAGSAAATLYHGSIIAGPINDDPENYTRFLCITAKDFTAPDANRSSIIIQEPDNDTAGTLLKALSVFAQANINLSKLDSHPLPGKQRRYAFYIDFDESIESDPGKKAIIELKNLGWDVQILGSYKADKH